MRQTDAVSKTVLRSNETIVVTPVHVSIPNASAALLRLAGSLSKGSELHLFVDGGLALARLTRHEKVVYAAVPCGCVPEGPHLLSSIETPKGVVSQDSVGNLYLDNGTGIRLMAVPKWPGAARGNLEIVSGSRFAEVIEKVVDFKTARVYGVKT